MNVYEVTVKPNANAFAAIQRFDPSVLIELEANDENAETYTLSSAYVLDSLLDNAPAWSSGTMRLLQTTTATSHPTTRSLGRFNHG